MFLSVRRCAEHMTQLPRLKVKGFTLEFRVHSIFLEPFGRFSLSFTQMFLSVRQCAECMTRLHRLNVKVTLQGHVIYPSIRVRSISPESIERFSLNFTHIFRSISPEPFGRFSFSFTQMFLSVRQYAEPMTRLRRLKVKVTFQSRGIYLLIRGRSISPKPFERFSLNFTQMFLSVRW